jgi:glutamine synthetase
MTIEDTLQRMAASDIKQVRLAWCDLHGELRSKTLMPLAVEDALRNGIGMVGTLALKDTSDRTAFKVFEDGGVSAMPEFANAANLVLRPVLSTYQELPWAPGTAWLQGQLYHADGRPASIDTRHVLQTAIDQLEAQGLGLRCGLEVEFHIYKIESTRPQFDPELAAWPGLPPAVSMLHPGYQLLSEQYTDWCDAPLRIVRDTAQALGLPLTSLEIEFGPSQFEAVFEATDAMTAADQMVLFRSATRQALRRAGYHATFMCRPPFAGIMSSGWHLHQSLVQLDDASNVFALPPPADAQADWYKRAMAPLQTLLPIAKPLAAASYLSATGCHYLAGLLAHAAGTTALSNPSINAYARFAPHALAPQSVVWGHDNRGAMLRVIAPRDNLAGTRIENRVGEPMANPYLYLASQIYAGVNGMAHKLAPPLATVSPYAADAVPLPATLASALEALQNDAALCSAFGATFVGYFNQIKRQEIARHHAAQDPVDWQRREIFARF